MFFWSPVATFTSLPIAFHFDFLTSLSCLSGSGYTVALLLCKGIMDISAQFLMDNSEVIIRNRPYVYPHSPILLPPLSCC